jgi:hypothetical protein
LSLAASQPAAATTSFIADKLYCTIDTSRVREEKRSKAQPGAVGKEIKGEIRTAEG